MLKRTLFWHDPTTSEQVKASLASGHVAITSTDTILGLLAPQTPQGFDALNAIKGGRSSKQYLTLISSVDKLVHYVNVDQLDSRVVNALSQCWPGPLTIIFKARPELPKFLTGQDGTIALRCPAHLGLLELLGSYDGLFSTSANQSGRTPPQLLEQISPDVMQHVDLIVLDAEDVASESESPAPSVSSTLIDVSDVDNKGIGIAREGAVSSQQLKQLFGDLIKI